MAGKGREHREPGGFASLEALSKGNCADCLGEPPSALKNHSHTPCPDCGIRGALSPVDDHVLFNKQTGGSRAAKCETCKGTGAVPLYGKDRMDPYARKGWVVAG